MQLTEVSPHDLFPNPWNTNVVAPANEAKLEASIRRNGIFKPFIVREHEGQLQILGGEHRWEVAKRLGLATVPIANLGVIDDVRAKEISVLDNARYGADDTLSFAELLKEIGGFDELQEFLPYGDADLKSIFSSADIALDELDLSETPDFVEEEEPPAASAPKTHTIMRMKVSLKDAERLTALIARTQKRHGFTAADDLTNAGDALVHLLLDQFAAAAAEAESEAETEIDELEALLEQSTQPETT